MQAVLTADAAFAELARRELDLALPPGAAVEEVAPGVWLVAAPGRLGDLAPRLIDTVFIRHACPAEAEIDPRGGLTALATAAADLRVPQDAQVQVRLLPGAPAWSPGAVAAAVRDHLTRAGVRTTGGPAPNVLSVTVAEDRAWVGAGPVAHNLSPWPGGAARLRAASDEVSRSARKVEEAVELFGVPLAAGTRALDLGAAPGGWTGWLLARGATVTAVDTGDLAPVVRHRTGVTFLRGSALQVPLPPGPFDLLCADLSWDPLRAADCVLRFRSTLGPGAHGICTVKFFGGPPREIAAGVRRRWEEAGVRVVAVRHLFHNRAEATAHLRF